MYARLVRATYISGQDSSRAEASQNTHDKRFRATFTCLPSWSLDHFTSASARIRHSSFDILIIDGRLDCLSASTFHPPPYWYTPLNTLQDTIQTRKKTTKSGPFPSGSVKTQNNSVIQRSFQDRFIQSKQESIQVPIPSLLKKIYIHHAVIL